MRTRDKIALQILRDNKLLKSYVQATNVVRVRKPIDTLTFDEQRLISNSNLKIKLDV